MSTWPTRKINILTDNQSPEISVWLCYKIVDLTAAKKNNILTVNQVVKDLCMSLWQNVDLTAEKNQHPNCQSVSQRPQYESVTRLSTWPPRKINILTVSQSSKISVWVCDKVSTWPPRKINILTDSQSSKISVRVCDKMSTWPPRKIQHPNCQSVVKDLCMSLWQNVDLTAAKNQHPNCQSVVKDHCVTLWRKCRPDRREKSTS